MRNLHEVLYVNLMFSSKKLPLNEEWRIFLDNALKEILSTEGQIDNFTTDYLPNPEKETLYQEIKKIFSVLVKEANKDSEFIEGVWDPILSYSAFLEQGYFSGSEEETAEALVFNKQVWEYIYSHYKLSDEC